MLLAVEESAFAMLADALLKQTNRKNEEGKKSKNNTFKCLGVNKKEKHWITYSPALKMIAWWSTLYF